MNGLTFDLLANFLALVLLETFDGYLSTPATKACGNWWAFEPSSCGLTMTTFLPA
jgi:hypothetical protein